MQIIIDSREQKPFMFGGELYAGTEIKAGTLQAGDYSLAGLENHIAIERKSLADLVMCLGRERARFEKEIVRGRGLDFFAVVVEGSWRDLANGNYRSQLNAHSAAQSVAAFMARHKCPFFFAESRRAAEYATWSLLRQYLTGKQYEYKAISQAIA